MKSASSFRSNRPEGTAPWNWLNRISRNFSEGRESKTSGNPPENKLLLKSSSYRSLRLWNAQFSEVWRETAGYERAIEVDSGDCGREVVIWRGSAEDSGVVAHIASDPVGREVLRVGGDGEFPSLEGLVGLKESRVLELDLKIKLKMRQLRRNDVVGLVTVVKMHGKGDKKKSPNCETLLRSRTTNTRLHSPAETKRISHRYVDAQEFLNYLLNELVNILEKEARATKSDQERKEQRLERGVYRGYRIAAIEGRYSHRAFGGSLN
ncbi:ubiquitin carboxyl-terminal hydrolase [Striga asiatica]|uniref:Ubiquitin carboxyl-terminal hydrolase n=1 Tax=Striga asiatica TaxID=4170 RepID=A0A5A7PNQ5_STRAF|nr:ubiquitin carboxyl-terminal hydrolase [Striga asiatica]